LRQLLLPQYRLAAVLFSMLLLFGCATGQQFSSEAVKPRIHGAMLYVYRSPTLLGVANPDVPIMHLDGRRLTRIRIGGYVALPISPGRHKLVTTESLLGSDTGKVRGETTFSIPAGSTLYLRYSESFKTFVPIPLPGGVVVISSGDFRFEFVPESEARSELANTKALELDGTSQ
jgi:hypothetical protein